MIRRRTAINLAMGLPLAAGLAASLDAIAQTKKDTLVLAMTLEPPGLDPTAGAAAAIGEVVHYNLFETLTKIGADSTISPLLAQRWEGGWNHPLAEWREQLGIAALVANSPFRTETPRG